MSLDKLKTMSETYVKDIDSNIESITDDKQNITNIEYDKKEKVLNELIGRTTSVYELHQENTLKTGLLVTEILKGVSEGEDIYCLFLKAIECVGFTTGDTTILPVCKKNLELVYGYGGVSNLPLEMKLQETEQRLNNLIQAKQTESDSDVVKRIEAAIKTHEIQIETIKNNISSHTVIDGLCCP